MVVRDLGISVAEIPVPLGDRACLAQGRISGEPVLTTDRAWNNLDLGVEIRVVR